MLRIFPAVVSEFTPPVRDWMENSDILPNHLFLEKYSRNGSSTFGGFRAMQHHNSCDTFRKSLFAR